MAQMVEKRETVRHEIMAPIKLAQGLGKTRDFSFTGVYFTTKVSYRPGDDLQFEFDLKYALPSQEVPLNCQGQVLRVENLGNAYGVAARIDNISYLN